MQPNQPMAPATPPSGNPYEFIMNPAKPPKRSILSGTDTSSFILRLALIVGGAIVLMIGIGVVINVMFGDKTNAAVFINIAQTQNELQRVAAQDNQASDQNIINAATNTELTMITQQKQLLAFLAKHGQKVPAKTLALKKDTTTDRTLAAAAAASTYDSVFTRVMVAQLQTYSDQLSKAYKNSTSKTERSLLSTDYNQAQLLLKQWPTPDNAQTTN